MSAVFVYSSFSFQFLISYISYINIMTSPKYSWYLALAIRIYTSTFRYLHANKSSEKCFPGRFYILLASLAACVSLSMLADRLVHVRYHAITLSLLILIM